MDCKQVRELMFLFDHEMDADLVVTFREHLSSCPKCAQASRRSRRLVVIFRRKCVRANAPQRLRRRILTSLPPRSGPTKRTWE